MRTKNGQITIPTSAPPSASRHSFASSRACSTSSNVACRSPRLRALNDCHASRSRAVAVAAFHAAASSSQTSLTGGTNPALVPAHRVHRFRSFVYLSPMPELHSKGLAPERPSFDLAVPPRASPAPPYSPSAAGVILGICVCACHCSSAVERRTGFRCSRSNRTLAAEGSCRTPPPIDPPAFGDCAARDG